MTTLIPGPGPTSAAQRFSPSAPPRVANTWVARVRRKLRHWFTTAPLGPDGWQAAHGPVMVIAPHPDDEVIGCGGTVRRHVAAGDPVSVVYLTRGESSCGYPWLSPAQKKATRTEEAKASCAVLGVRDTVFLDGADGHCSEPTVAEALAGDLAAAIDERKPLVIYVPHADDNHPDHAAAYRLVTGIARGRTWRPTIYQYELWSPLTADFAVDVSGEMKAKIRAIKRHHLALDAFDYVPTMIGLAAYRSGTMLQRKGYAEAFRRTADLYPS